MDGDEYIKFWKVIAEVSTEGVWIPAAFVRMCSGDANAAMLLAQILYWYKKMGGEFYKRHGWDDGDGWEAEIGLGEEQSRRSTRKLERLEYISTRVGHGKDHRRATFYTLKPEELVRNMRIQVGV